MKTIREELLDGKRYYDVKKLLNETIEIKEPSVPVSCYSVNGRVSFSMATESLRHEASILLNLIDCEIDKFGLKEDTFSQFANLYNYFNDRTDNVLHNIANHLTHTGCFSEEELEHARKLQVITNLIVCLGNEREEGGYWKIPEGWKGKE